MSFVVEIPSVFTKPTQIPMRLGNTILTGNETIQGSLSVNGSLTLNSGGSVDNVVYYYSLDISNNLNVGGDATIGGTLTIPTIGDVGTAISGKQATIDSNTDLTLNSITTNGLNVNNVLTYEKELLFDTIVIRRPTGITGDEFYFTNLYELQVWVGGVNILPSTATSSYFSLWTGDKDADLGNFTNGEGTNMYDEVISEDGVSISSSTYQSNPNIALVINLSSVNAYTIQALVLYNRTSNTARQNRAVGLAIELYNRANDSTLSTPLISTNEITSGEIVYRYDFPQIYTYTSFVGSVSTEFIVNDTYAETEVISITTSNSPVEITTNLTITGDLTINGTPLATSLSEKQPTIGTETDLTLNSITTNNLNVGGVITYESLLFDTIVIRRPSGTSGDTGTGAFYINLYELQVWINGTNILPSSATSSYFSLWTGDKDADLGSYSGNPTTKMYDTNISEDGLSISPSSNSNTALVIRLSSLNAYNIQSLVLYNRLAGVSDRAEGLAIELYNRANDSTLSSPILSTNEITSSRDVYRYDFPAIDTYPSASFIGENSIDYIVNDTYALKEVVSITSNPVEITTDLSITGDLTITGNATIGGNVSATTLTVATSAIINKTLIHNPFPNAMCIAHSNFTSTLDYALLQYSEGSTILNAPLGKFISFANNGTAVASIGATGYSSSASIDCSNISATNISTSVVTTTDAVVTGFLSRSNNFIRRHRNGTETLSGTSYQVIFGAATITNDALVTANSTSNLFTVVKPGRYRISSSIVFSNGTYTDRVNWRSRLFTNDSYSTPNGLALVYTRHRDYGTYATGYHSTIKDFDTDDTFYYIVDCNKSAETNFTSDMTGLFVLTSTSLEIEYLGE